MRVIDEQIGIPAEDLRHMVFMFEGNDFDIGKIKPKDRFDRCDGNGRLHKDRDVVFPGEMGSKSTGAPFSTAESCKM